MKENHSCSLSHCLKSIYSWSRKNASMRVIWPTVNIEWDETCLKSVIYFLQATRVLTTCWHADFFYWNALLNKCPGMLVGSGFHEQELCVEDCHPVLFTKQSFEFNLISKWSPRASPHNANISLYEQEQHHNFVKVPIVHCKFAKRYAFEQILFLL